MLASSPPTFDRSLEGSKQPDLLTNIFFLIICLLTTESLLHPLYRINKNKCLQYLKLKPLSDFANLSSAVIHRYMSKPFPEREQSTLTLLKKMLRFCMNFKQLDFVQEDQRSCVMCVHLQPSCNHIHCFSLFLPFSIVFQG